MSKSPREQSKIAEEIVDFDVIKENWHIYELEDDTTVRTKTVLMNILDGGPSEENPKIHKYVLQAKLLNVVSSPNHLKGKKDKSWRVSELEKFITESNMKFRQLKDGGPAEYRTKKGIITVQSRIRQVDKTSKYDARGNPAYIIRAESVMLIRNLDEEETESNEKQIK